MAHAVKIKDFHMDLDVKNNGVEFEVKDGNTHLGDLYVTKSKLIWCAGRITRQRGKEIKWADFAALMEKL